MEAPFLLHPPVYLRALRREDLNDNYLGWLNDQDVTRYLETGAFPSRKEDLDRFYESTSGRSDQVVLAIVDCESDRHIGNAKLGPINWIHRRATFGILIGEKTFWGRGIGTIVTKLIVEYAFYRLDLRKVDLGVYADHAGAVRTYQNVGFQIEGRLRQDYFLDGCYKDRLWMGLLRSEYQREGAQ